MYHSVYKIIPAKGKNSKLHSKNSTIINIFVSFWHVIPMLGFLEINMTLYWQSPSLPALIYCHSDRSCPPASACRIGCWRMCLFSHILRTGMSCSIRDEIFSLADFQEGNACSIMTRDSIQASKGQACVCVICRQCWDNWLQNIVWCRGNLYSCILFWITVL